MELFSILGLLLSAGVLAVILRQYKEEYAVAVTVAAGAVVLTFILVTLAGPLLEFKDLIHKAGVGNSYLKIALKTLGICLICGFISDVCKDFGQSALANFTGSVGRCVIFIMSVPLLSELLKMALLFIGK